MFKGTVKEKWADLKNSSRFTGLVLGLLGVMKLLNDLGKPRVEALHGIDVLGLVTSGMLLRDRLRWPDGQAELRQLPEGPKQAATERVGCVEGVGHNIPNIDGLDSIIRSEPPSPVSEWVSFCIIAGRFCK